VTDSRANHVGSVGVVLLFIVAVLLALLGTVLLYHGLTMPRTDVGASFSWTMVYAGAACWTGTLLVALGLVLRKSLGRAASRRSRSL
jgi:hypothetical protein